MIYPIALQPRRSATFVPADAGTFLGACGRVLRGRGGRVSDSAPVPGLPTIVRRIRTTAAL